MHKCSVQMRKMNVEDNKQINITRIIVFLRIADSQQSELLMQFSEYMI